MNNPPWFSQPLALELVKNGFVVVTFNWTGQTPQENRQLARSNLQATLRSDVRAAIEYLKTRKDVDARRIAIGGHSVGGNLAVDAAIDDPTVAAVACIGMAREVEGAAPANLLWIAGLYDEFWPPSSLASAYKANVGYEPHALAHTAGTLEGTGRALAISPTADHFTEMFDWRVHRAVVNWFLKATGLKQTRGAYWQELRCLTFTVAWLAALVAGLATARSFVSGRPMLLRGIPSVMLFGVVLLHFVGSGKTASAVLYLVALAVLTDFIWCCSSEDLSRRCHTILRAGLVLWGSIVFTLCLNAIPSYIREPSFLVFIPEFVVRHLLDWLYAYLLLYPRQLLLGSGPANELTVRGWVYCLLIIELVAPGLLSRLGSGLFRRRRAKSDRDFRHVSAKHVVVLVILAIVLAAMVWLRLGQGFITAESLLAALRFMLRFGIVPIAAFAVLWRLCKRFWPIQPT
jgi:dienelactone hydrolase